MDLLVEGATLLDLGTGELHGGSSVRVEGDRIVETAHGRTLAANDEIRRIDAGDRVLLPGFIDAHVHAAFTTMNLAELWTRAPSRRAIETKNILEAMLRRGFTTVRDAGGLDRGLFHSLDDDGRRRYAAAVHRAARPDATLLLSCFSEANPVGEEPRPAVSEDTLRDVLGGAGWDIASVEPATVPGELDGAQVEMAFWYLRAQRR